jgi:hypothetical protein
MDTSNEWELSKENVQPLRQGRIVSSLTSALQHCPVDLQQIKEQKEWVFKHVLDECEYESVCCQTVKHNPYMGM